MSKGMGGRRLYGAMVILLGASQLVVVVLSWLLKAFFPEWQMRSLLSEEGARWLFGHFTDNLLSEHLVWLLLALGAYSTLRGSGLLQVVRRRMPWKSLSYRERLALRCVLVEVLLVVVVVGLLTFPYHAVLRNVSGDLFPSSFSASILPVASATVGVASLTYAFVGAEDAKLSDIHRILTLSGNLYGLIPIYLLARQLWCMLVYVWY